VDPLGSALSALVGMVPEAANGRAVAATRIIEAARDGQGALDGLWRALTVGVSLFNALLLIYLGLTVVLTSRRRTWGVWLIAAALFLAAAVFLDNARCAADMGVGGVTALFEAWWPAGWFPAVLLPLAWHVAMLWYVGFWSASAPERDAVRRKHLRWLVATATIAICGCLVLAYLDYRHVGLLIAVETFPLLGIPVMIWIYVAFVACATLAPVRALAAPPHDFELWRDLGRQRARPWLIAASWLMLVSGLAIAYVTLPILGIFEVLGVPSDYDEIIRFCAWCDLVISVLVGGVILLLAQAVIAYEVFAGRTLPRRGLRRHAANAAVLALAHAVVVPWASARWQTPAAGLLFCGVVAVGLYAVLAWAAHREHERHLNGLRPLVHGGGVFDQLRGNAAPTGPSGAREPFRALCEGLLETTRAALVPAGPFAPLVGGAMCYPADDPVAAELAALTSSHSRSPGADPETFGPGTPGGYSWSVPLWGARGMTGVLLLGPKRHGGLYTQEEIATAQHIAERLLDTEATFRLAERLMELQRRRLAESQVLDRRVRREIHDEILPRLHAAMLEMPRDGQMLDELALVHRRLAGLLREMPSSVPEVERVGLVQALRREVAGALSGGFEEVVWDVSPDAEAAAERLSPVVLEVVFYAAREALRNVASHARGDDPDRPIRVRIGLEAGPGLLLTVEDNGVGIGAARPDAERGGKGLALHGTMMAILGGDLVAERIQPEGTRVTLALPQHMPGVVDDAGPAPTPC